MNVEGLCVENPYIFRLYDAASTLKDCFLNKTCFSENMFICCIALPRPKCIHFCKIPRVKVRYKLLSRHRKEGLVPGYWYSQRQMKTFSSWRGLFHQWIFFPCNDAANTYLLPRTLKSIIHIRSEVSVLLYLWHF